MHRSGSSAITKGLEVMGVELGTQLMPATADNQKGYFEDIEINQFNTRLLKTKGLDWNTLTPIKTDDFQGDHFSPFKEEATDILERKLLTDAVLGIKDPRLCRLLPFWMEIFDDLKLEVSYVIILRNPENIAASLISRDAIPRVKSLYLWLEHMIPVFRETRNCSRAILDYDNLIAKPERTIKALAKKLGLEKAIDQAVLSSYAKDFIDPGLRHHQTTSDPEQAFTPKGVERLSFLLADSRNRKNAFISAKFYAEIEAIEQDYRDRSDLLQYIDTLDAIILRDHYQRVDLEANIETLSESLDKKTSSLKSKNKTLSTHNAQIRDFKNTLKEKDDQLSNLGLSLSGRDAQVEDLDLQVTDRDSQIDGLNLQVADRDSQIEVLNLLMAEHKAEIAALTDLSAKQDSAIKASKASLDKFEIDIKLVEKQKRDTEHEIQKLQLFMESVVSDTENFSLQLDQIRSSLFWKLSFLSRKFWHTIEFLFAAKKTRFHLIPNNETERLSIANNAWRSTGTDPFFKLVPTSGQMRIGWVRVKSRIQYQSPEKSLKLYLDCGLGTNEDSSYRIPVLPGGNIDELVFLPQNLRSLRWDPMQKEGEFKQAPIVFIHHAWLRRKIRMLRRVISTLTSAPKSKKAEAGLSWKLIFGDLNQAYVAAGKVIISRDHD